MQIKVTEKHIKEGIKGSCALCPIAVAVLENAPGIEAAHVAGNYVSLYDKNWERRSRPLPLEAESFISNFDQGFKVEPFTFELNI